MSFLNYTGIIEEFGQLYKFKMKYGSSIQDKYYLNIANPTIDNSFKRVFFQKVIVRSCLNSIVFPNKYRIEEISLLPTESPGEVEYYGRGSIRFDCPLKCILNNGKTYPKVNKQDAFGLYIDDNEIIVDIEMQIGGKSNLDDIYMNYMKKLIMTYNTNKILILSLLYTPEVINPKNNKGNLVTFTKSELKNPGKFVQIFDDCIIYQLDLNYCMKLLNNNESVYLLNKSQILKETGKEWIKFLTIPIWCKSKKEKFFAFPPLERLSFNDDNVKSALKTLVDKSDNREYDSQYEARENFLKHFEEYENTKKENSNLREQIDDVNKENERLKKLLESNGIRYKNKSKGKKRSKSKKK